jgi:hypothetical protein
VGIFEAFYAGPVQHPILLWVAALIGGAVCWTRRGIDPSLRRYGLALTVLSLADAWLTSNHIYGIGALAGSAAIGVPLFFVLAGDFRFLLLIGIGTDRGGLAWNGARVLGAVALTAIVPLLSQGIVALLPDSDSGSRVLFLVYEVAFFLLTALLLRVHPNLRGNGWLRTLSRFVLLYYGLWASADLILLGTGSDLGFLLRVVPNLFYYGGLIAVIGWSGARAASESRLETP